MIAAFAEGLVEGLGFFVGLGLVVVCLWFAYRFLVKRLL